MQDRVEVNSKPYFYYTVQYKFQIINAFNFSSKIFIHFCMMLNK